MKKKRSQSENGKYEIKKLNNQGMTLMEILIAMIILSVVGVVFLNSFVHAFRVNEMAKQKQYSMILAQSLMESVKAYDIVALDNQFSGSDAGFRVYNLGADGTKSFVMSGVESRTYSLQGIVYQKDRFGERYKYDVDVLVEPTANAEKLVKAQGINPYSDAIYVEAADEQAALRDAIKADLTTQGNVGTVTTLNTSKLSTTRTIKVDISNDDVVTVQSVYSYSAHNYPITKTGGITANVSFTGTVDANEDPITCYDKPTINEPGVTLVNLYIYYYPAYGSSTDLLVGCTSDKIEITNNSSTLENIYLIKQENSNLTTTQIDSFEGSYQPQVNVTSSTELNLIHNLAKVLHGNGALYPGIIGNVADRGEPWKEDDEKTTLLYDVKVTVKKWQADHNGDVVCEIAGTTNKK